jgi:hypothetical protein
MGKYRLLTIFFINLRDISIHQKQVNPRSQSSFTVADLFAMPSGSTIVRGDKKEGTYHTNRSVAKLKKQMLARDTHTHIHSPEMVL